MQRPSRSEPLILRASHRPAWHPELEALKLKRQETLHNHAPEQAAWAFLADIARHDEKLGRDGGNSSEGAAAPVVWAEVQKTRTLTTA